MHVAGDGVAVGAGRFRLEDLRQRLEVIRGATDPALSAQAPVLEAKLAEWSARRARAVPEGLIHGDLFRDNVLWETEAGGEIAALLDFESASRGPFVFDLMVTVLSWSFGEGFHGAVARGICDGYRSVRELAEEERAALPAEGCLAALRFTITRITDYAMKGGIGPRVIKDWKRFAMRLHALEELGPAGVREALGVAAF
jgi:homoserine kinase type II